MVDSAPMPWLLDRLTLRPTRQPVDLPDGATRIQVPFGARSVELILQTSNEPAADRVDLVVCKFVGAGGRAEKFSLHPFERLSQLRGVVCGVNPPGYGQSEGRADLQTMVPAAHAAVDYVRELYPRCRLLLAGSSLGAAVALRVAADLKERQDDSICGLILRDPPQIYDVIMQRFGWWTGWLPAWTVARKVPQTLDAYASAAACQGVPAIVLTSLADTVVPPDIQQRVLSAYAGPVQVVLLAEANHSEPLTEQEGAEYGRCLERLWHNILDARD